MRAAPSNGDSGRAVFTLGSCGANRSLQPLRPLGTGRTSFTFEALRAGNSLWADGTLKPLGALRTDRSILSQNLPGETVEHIGDSRGGVVIGVV